MQSKLIHPCIWMLITVLGAIAQQESTPPANGNDAPVRDEIRTIEGLLPKLADRGPALSELAHDYALLGDLKKGMSLLEECISLHEGFDPETDPAFEPLKTNAHFKSLVEEVHREFPPVHRAAVAFTVPESDLIPEGLAVDHQRHLFYLGSMSHKKIVKITRAGAVSDFVAEGKYHFESVCGIKVDPANEDVWANTCPDSGRGAELLHFNIQGELLERFSQPTPGPHLFNDLVLRNPDQIYLTDSLANQAYRFDRKKYVFEPLAFPRPMYYPNGIALSGDGNLLYIADAFGVLQYDLRNQKAREVQPGPSTTVSGFDGLYWYRGSLVGIQNSLGLPRAVRFELSPDGSHVTATRVLEYRSEYVELPTTGAIDGSEFYFMANTQIDNWKNGKIVDPKKLAPVRVALIHLD